MTRTTSSTTLELSTYATFKTGSPVYEKVNYENLTYDDLPIDLESPVFEVVLRDPGGRLQNLYREGDIVRIKRNGKLKFLGRINEAKPTKSEGQNYRLTGDGFYYNVLTQNRTIPRDAFKEGGRPSVWRFGRVNKLPGALDEGELIDGLLVDEIIKSLLGYKLVVQEFFDNLDAIDNISWLSSAVTDLTDARLTNAGFESAGTWQPFEYTLVNNFVTLDAATDETFDTFSNFVHWGRSNTNAYSGTYSYRFETQAANKILKGSMIGVYQDNITLESGDILYFRAKTVSGASINIKPQVMIFENNTFNHPISSKTNDGVALSQSAVGLNSGYTPFGGIFHVDQTGQFRVALVLRTEADIEESFNIHIDDAHVGHNGSFNNVILDTGYLQLQTVGVAQDDDDEDIPVYPTTGKVRSINFYHLNPNVKIPGNIEGTINTFLKGKAYVVQLPDTQLVTNGDMEAYNNTDTLPFTGTKRPVAWWRFEETSGDAINSGGASGNTLTGTATRSIVGQVGNCFNFGGTENMNCASTNGFPNGPGAAWSLAAWVRWESSGGGTSRVVMAIGDGSANRTPHLSTQNTDKWRLGTGGADIDATTGPSIGVWYHLVGTCDGVNLKLYVNGELVASGANASNNPLGTQVRVGQYPNGTSNWDGDIDEPMVFTYDLTQQQALVLYNKGRFGVPDGWTWEGDTASSQLQAPGDVGTYSHKIYSIYTGTFSRRMYRDLDVVPETGTYKLKFRAKGTGIARVFLYNLTTSSDLGDGGYTLTDSWQTFEYTRTLTAGNSYRIYAGLTDVGNAGDEVYLDEIEVYQENPLVYTPVVRVAIDDGSIWSTVPTANAVTLTCKDLDGNVLSDEDIEDGQEVTWEGSIQTADLQTSGAIRYKFRYEIELNSDTLGTTKIDYAKFDMDTQTFLREVSTMSPFVYAGSTTAPVLDTIATYQYPLELLQNATLQSKYSTFAKDFFYERINDALDSVISATIKNSTITRASMSLFVNNVAWWKLDDTALGTAVDSSGNGYNGTAGSLLLVGQNGAYSYTGRSYAFNGNTGAAGGGVLTTLTPSATNFTWTTLLKLTTATAGEILSAIPDSGTGGLRVRVVAGPKLQFVWVSDYGTETVETDSGIFTTGRWARLTLTVTERVLTVYKDGVQVYSYQFKGKLINLGQFAIGGRLTNASFTGFADDVAIFSVTATKTQVEELLTPDFETDDSNWDFRIDHTGKVYFQEHIGRYFGKSSPIKKEFSFSGGMIKLLSPKRVATDIINNLTYIAEGVGQLDTLILDGTAFIDTASVLQYGMRIGVITEKDISDVIMASNRANALLRQFSSPAVSMEAEFLDEELDQLDLGDIVYIKDASTATDGDFRIVSKTYTVDRSGEEIRVTLATKNRTLENFVGKVSSDFRAINNKNPGTYSSGLDSGIPKLVSKELVYPQVINIPANAATSLQRIMLNIHSESAISLDQTVVGAFSTETDGTHDHASPGNELHSHSIDPTALQAALSSAYRVGSSEGQLLFPTNVIMSVNDASGTGQVATSVGVNVGPYAPFGVKGISVFGDLSNSQQTGIGFQVKDMDISAAFKDSFGAWITGEHILYFIARGSENATLNTGNVGTIVAKVVMEQVTQTSPPS